MVFEVPSFFEDGSFGERGKSFEDYPEGFTGGVSVNGPYAHPLWRRGPFQLHRIKCSFGRKIDTAG
jgi:hypothetical protein